VLDWDYFVESDLLLFEMVAMQHRGPPASLSSCIDPTNTLQDFADIWLYQGGRVEPGPLFPGIFGLPLRGPSSLPNSDIDPEKQLQGSGNGLLDLPALVKSDLVLHPRTIGPACPE
jgi:hypothetical protein